MANFFVQLWLACLKIIFTFLHLIYSGLQYFDFVWSMFKRKLLVHEINEDMYIAQCVAGLEKRPRHLALILGGEVIQYEDVTNIIIWCLAAGISFLSVYDHAGVLRDTESKLYNYVVSRIKTSTQVKFRNIPITNGISSKYNNKIIVNILSEMDGKEAFTNTVKRLCAEGREPRELTIGVISDEIKSESKFPDPDLAIIVGPVACTYGYSPWQIPVTEFVKIRSLENIQAENFFSMLSRYSSCQQRYGK